jgi:hypothetical protein
MTTIIKIIIVALLSLTLFSCNFDFGPGVQGNGNVQIEERPINAPFSAIHVATGLNVYLAQSDNETITVEADENLQELIVTEVVNNVLKIHSRKNIGPASSKKVLVNFKEISKINASSGSSVQSTNTITSKDLDLSSSSGSTMKISLNSNALSCSSSSGSSLHLTGETDKLIARSASGSSIRAGDLNAVSTNVEASSGSSITINTLKELTANASSGASIRYYGSPEKVNKSNSSGGSVVKK